MTRNNSFSPLHEGDTSVAAHSFSAGVASAGFQSPSRGGHLRGQDGFQIQGRFEWFQSPSRGGHLRGQIPRRPSPPPHLGFSPLHEGDTSVAFSFS